MDRTGCFWCAMAPHAAWKGKLLKKLPQAFFVLTLVGIDFRVGTFQIHRRQNTWSAVARSGQKDHVQIVLFDKAVQMDVDERQPGTGTPVSQKPIFDVLYL